MNTAELYGLTTWIEREVVARRIAELYGTLSEIINGNVQANQAKRPFEDQRNELYAALRQVDLASLSMDQIHFLERLGLLPYLSEQGVLLIEEALVKNPVDVATAAARMREMVQAVRRGVERAAAIRSSLSELVEVPSESVDRVLVRVAFTGGASMDNVADFKRWGAEWHDIGRGIAMAHGLSPQDIKVVGAKTGSIIIELGVAVLIAKAVVAIILESLKVAERVLELRKKAEEIRALKLTNDKISAAIEAEAEDIKGAEVERIADEVAKRISKLDGEQITALTMSIRKMVSFVESGGEVDCVVPDEAGDAVAANEETLKLHAELRELRKEIAELRALESKVKRIGYQTPVQQQQG